MLAAAKLPELPQGLTTRCCCTRQDGTAGLSALLESKQPGTGMHKQPAELGDHISLVSAAQLEKRCASQSVQP